MRTIPTAPDTVLERLTRLHPKLIDLSLDRVERLLERLGSPHQKLPPVVHVAGTNGKGSVIAFLHACLQAAGYRAHVYTSPHLVRFNERIVLGGTAISDEALVPILEECEDTNRDDLITFFEITTVAAFLAFARHQADIVLLETGLGGRLDATNLIDAPVLTVLTPISIDHQQFLGETLAEIAHEKAGILKPGVPCIVAKQSADVFDVIQNQAAALEAPLICEGPNFSVHDMDDHLLVEQQNKTGRFPLPALIGAHQHQNAATAIAGLDHLEGFAVDEAAIAEGVRAVKWPARLQRLAQGPLVERLPRGWELWLDGGHNEAAGHVLADYMRTWTDRPLYLVFGMLNSKSPGPFLSPLRAGVSGLQAVAIPGVQASWTAAEAAAAARDQNIQASPADSVTAALEAIAKSKSEPARVLICGSLYLAGAVLKENE